MPENQNFDAAKPGSDQAKVQELLAAHPELSVQRDVAGRLSVYVGNGKPYGFSRRIDLRPLWSTEEQEKPDLMIDVFDGEQDGAHQLDTPTTSLLVKVGSGDGGTELASGQEVDTSEVTETARHGLELFEKYLDISPEERSAVPASKAYDEMRGHAEMKGIFRGLGISGAGTEAVIGDELQPSRDILLYKEALAAR